MNGTDARLYCSTAIANTLVTAWATGKLFNQHPSGSSSSPAAPAAHKM